MGDSIIDLHFQEPIQGISSLQEQWAEVGAHCGKGLCAAGLGEGGGRGGQGRQRWGTSTHRCAQQFAPVWAQVEEDPPPGTRQGGPTEQQDEEDQVGQRGRHPHHLQQGWPSAMAPGTWLQGWGGGDAPHLAQGSSHLPRGFHPFPQAEVNDGEDEEETEEQLPADPPHVVQTTRLLKLQDLPPMAGQGLMVSPPHDAHGQLPGPLSCSLHGEPSAATET